MRHLALLIHLLAVILWVGGMSFAHNCLRPVLMTLAPPQRLVLQAGILGRFFAQVSVALVLLWVSGLWMMQATGFAQAPASWHAMMGAALVMTVVFGVIRFVHFPRLVAGVGTQQWEQAGAAMTSIRLLVMVNLVLGVVTVIVAVLGHLLV